FASEEILAWVGEVVVGRRFRRAGEVLGEQQADGDRQVVKRAFFAHVCRGKVDHDLPQRVAEARVCHRRADALDGLFNGGGRQAGDRGFGCAIAIADLGEIVIDLYLAGEGINALQKVRLDTGEHVRRVYQTSSELAVGKCGKYG